MNDTIRWADVQAPSLADFEQMATAAWNRLPGEFRRAAGDVVIRVEDFATDDVLDQMGVDVIEAGFPIASDGDFEAVNEIAKLAKHSVICGLARASFGDIDRAGEAIKPAKRGRIHTFIGTSPLHRKFQLQLDQDQVFERVVASGTVRTPDLGGDAKTEDMADAVANEI